MGDEPQGSTKPIGMAYRCPTTPPERSGLPVPTDRMSIVARLGCMPGYGWILITRRRLGDLDDPPQMRCLRQQPPHVGSGARRRIEAWMIHQLPSRSNEDRLLDRSRPRPFEPHATDVLRRRRYVLPPYRRKDRRPCRKNLTIT